MWPFLDARSTDARCLDTTRALLLDGANGVCGEARLGAGSGGWLHLLALLAAAVLIAIALRWKPRLSPAMVVVAAIAALPGGYALLALRADRALARGDAAREGERLHDQLRAFARANECAQVTVDHCDACFPIARLALTDLRCEAPASIELHEDALGGECEARARMLVCGHPR